MSPLVSESVSRRMTVGGSPHCSVSLAVFGFGGSAGGGAAAWAGTGGGDVERWCGRGRSSSFEVDRLSGAAAGWASCRWLAELDG